MAFLKSIFFGRTEIKGVSTIRNIKFSGQENTPIRAEFHVFPDNETYQEWKNSEKRKKMDYDNVVKPYAVSSASLSPEKEAEFKKELLALFYKYLGEGEEV